jgi:hypothetical protein
MWQLGFGRIVTAVRAEVSRKLVEDCEITIAEIARQVGVSTSAISKRAWHAVIPVSQQRPYFFLPLPEAGVGPPLQSAATCPAFFLGHGAIYSFSIFGYLAGAFILLTLPCRMPLESTTGSIRQDETPRQHLRAG